METNQDTTLPRIQPFGRPFENLCTSIMDERKIKAPFKKTVVFRVWVIFSTILMILGVKLSDLLFFQWALHPAVLPVFRLKWGPLS